MYFVMLSTDTIQMDLHEGMTVFLFRITRVIFKGPRVLCKFLDCESQDQKSQVMPARTIHLLSQKEVIHIVFMLQKIVQDIFMVLLTFQLGIIWRFDFTNSLAKADKLITAVKTGD